MTDILRTEFFRLGKSKTFVTMLIVLALLPVLGWILSSVVMAVISSLGGFEIPSLSEITTSSLSEVADIGSVADLLGLICTAIFLSKEFTDGTIRNAILAAKTRNQIYFSYLIVALTVGLSMKLTYFLSLLFVCGIGFGFGSLTFFQCVTAIVTSLMFAIFTTVFVQTCTTMFLFVGKKQSSALVFPILIVTFATGIIETFAVIVDLIAGIDGVVNNEWKTWVPLLNLSYFDASAVDAGVFFKGVMYLLLFSVMFVFLGRRSFAKTDLK